MRRIITLPEHPSEIALDSIKLRRVDERQARRSIGSQLRQNARRDAERCGSGIKVGMSASYPST